jgi:hypothetical protein
MTDLEKAPSEGGPAQAVPATGAELRTGERGHLRRGLAARRGRGDGSERDVEGGRQVAGAQGG